LKKFLIAIVIAAAVTGSVQAQQQQPKAKAPASVAQKAPAAPAAPPQAEAAQPNTPPPPGWIVRCGSPSRDAPLECAMEQTAVLTKTGQLIVLVNIRVPGDTRSPVALIQLPLGLNLPAGAKVQVDDGKSVDLPIQTCEARGCFASTPIAADLLAAMKTGKQFKVSFQTLAKETVAIPMPLGDFAAAFEKIK
jgi:invasion protein IalB